MAVNKKTRKPGGGTRVAQNRKIRRDALREELQSREYIRQLEMIQVRLNPDAKDTFKAEDIPKVKERAAILFRLLDKSLPNLRPVDVPVQLPPGKTIADQGANILKAMAEGDITPSEAASLIQAVASQARIIEVDELEKRVTELENIDER